METWFLHDMCDMYVLCIYLYESRNHDPRPWLATGRLRVGHSVASGPLGRNRFGSKPPSPTRNTLWIYIPPPPHFLHLLHQTNTHLFYFLSTKNPKPTTSKLFQTFGSSSRISDKETRSRPIRTLHLLGSLFFVFGSSFHNRLVLSLCIFCV